MSETVPETVRLDAAFVMPFAERWHAAFNAKDAAALMELCTPDVVLEDPSRPAPLRGAEGARVMLETIGRAFPDYRFESTEPPMLSVSGPRATMPWRFTGTMTGPLDPPGFAPTGEVVTFDGVDLWEFDGERIAHTRAIFDVNAIAVAIGAAPAPGSRGERVGVLLQRLEARRRRGKRTA